METGIQIKITEHNGKKAVSARELYDFLESKSNFSDWIKYRIQQYDFIEGVDYVILSEISDKIERGRPAIDYVLSISCAKELSMVEGNAKGKQARQYFIACEEELKQKPLSTLEALKFTVQALEEQDRRLNAVESKINLIIERQTEAENELKMLPVSTEQVPEMSLRDKCRKLVNHYSIITGLYQQAVWDSIYQALYYNYHIAIKRHQKLNKSESWLDVADRKGVIDKIYIIISNLLKEKGIAA